MPAAVQAEVFAGDADPLEVLGGGEHPLYELVVFVLDPLSLHQSAPRLRHAIGEPVPNHLELTQAEHPRRGGKGVDAMRDPGVAEPLADESGELRLEPGDLSPQLQPGLALVDRNTRSVELPLSQQSRHLQKV